eukprot:TRINITY_DN44872_c0_g1_i1.p2 TRINITY_DN44872_c0_g1~~TRINITY_DN44872_c0_g1_i1.p2  ORF type:complete len:290 (+),score=85.25 TRINITY_DN44872_c0_g1_i1:70-939(+)
MPQDSVPVFLTAGCGAAVISRTVIAPIERVKILYQTSKGAGGWTSIAPRILREEGVLAFWRGNSAGVIRVMPYLSTQFASNELFRKQLSPLNLPVPVRNLFAGVLAGATAVSLTYPLDTARARLAVLNSHSGATQHGMVSLLREVYRTEGTAALYRGCWMSCVGGGVYAGIKFMSYDYAKEMFSAATGITGGDQELKVWHRAVSGAAGGLIAQTVAYPVDVMRRRMQTSTAAPYSGVIDGVVKIFREEGLTTGLYRGISLNYLKTVPNVAIYLSLYDVFKYRLQQYLDA